MYNYYLHLRTYLNVKQKELLNALSFNKTKKYTPFVILCEPRTGSTLLHTLLNFHTQIKSYGEILREKLTHAHATLPPDALATFVFKPHGRSLKAIGLKLFYFYHEDPVYTAAFQEVIQNDSVKIIHLIRKDTLALYVSLKTAQQTNQWTSVASTSRDTGYKLQVNPEEFRQFSTTYLKRQCKFNTLFEHHSMLIVSYEDLSNKPSRIMKDILQFLDVKQKPLFSMLKKQNRNSIESRLANYSELQSIADEVNKP